MHLVCTHTWVHTCTLPRAGRAQVLSPLCTRGQGTSAAALKLKQLLPLGLALPWRSWNTVCGKVPVFPLRWNFSASCLSARGALLAALPLCGDTKHPLEASFPCCACPCQPGDVVPLSPLRDRAARVPAAAFPGFAGQRWLWGCCEGCSGMRGGCPCGGTGWLHWCDGTT